MDRYTVEVVNACDTCGQSAYMVHDTVLDNDASEDTWTNMEAAELVCESANHFDKLALNSPAVTALLEAVHRLCSIETAGYDYPPALLPAIEAIEAAAEAVRKERGE